MSGAIARKPATASAVSWWRQEYQSSGQPWSRTTGKPAPASATCMRRPFAAIDRCRTASRLMAPRSAVPGAELEEAGAPGIGRTLTRRPEDRREERREEHVERGRGEEGGAPDPVDDEPHAGGGVRELPDPAREEDGRPAAPVARRE